MYTHMEFLVTETQVILITSVIMWDWKSVSILKEKKVSWNLSFSYYFLFWKSLKAYAEGAKMMKTYFKWWKVKWHGYKPYHNFSWDNISQS